MSHIRAVRRLRFALLLLPLLLLAFAAAAPAARSMVNAYFQVGLDDKAWQEKVVAIVAKGFQPKKSAAIGKKVVVIASIARSGRVASTLVNLSSGSPEWDAAGVEAVEKAKLPPLPKGYAREVVEVHFHFAAVK